MSWREYHELTKHSVESLRGTQHYLDWANICPIHFDTMRASPSWTCRPTHQFHRSQLSQYSKAKQEIPWLGTVRNSSRS